MLEIAVFVVVCVYLQIIINRDKRDRKRYEQIGKALDKEEKRRAKEEKLRSKRIKHPKVCYLDDYRQSLQTPQRII
jgi:Asp-tRNA(Asn)/Glu-tRNA(Gln) amidotransferase A subunit family amidase